MATRPGLDSPCPCGSGKAFDVCHLSGQVGGSDILISKLVRDDDGIAAGFDAAFAKELGHISRRLASIGARLRLVEFRFGPEPEDKLKGRICGILSNALASIMGAVVLARSGLPLQGGTLLRATCEGINSAIALDRCPEQLEAYERGAFDSGKALSEAKKSVPYLGKLYGVMSEHFAHLGSLSKADWGVKPLERGTIKAGLTFMMLSIALNSLEVAVELTLYDILPMRRLVRRVDPSTYECLMIADTPLQALWDEYETKDDRG